ncbi:PAS domain S-box-containing protein/diguanylate cyclase (GGDEF) domain-containing protein [Paraburkholderia phenazinium]|uniref:PAS domain S-box-containing protein/diguanylate cyclase (GGDEF) domain-containing protein n=2 Tax=Paraburkholderia phenazinium TaxID=60549 RepID=A0A1G8C2Y9_9BURK|nr:PAS domain S-box-containing protein/diguanylate cyclase (GGDEF) domain-containing protein [Paraburkholderia phenazinium]
MRQTWGRLLRPVQRAYAIGLALGMLLLGLAATVVVYSVTAQLIQREAKLRFDNDTRDVQQRIETRVRLYSDVLVTMQALFSAGDNVSRSEFRDFVNGLNLPERYPGFQTLNYAPYIRDADIGQFVASQRSDPILRDAGIDFAISPPGLRHNYYVLSYVEPLAPNLPSLGLDLGVQPRRLAALERSRDTGQPVSSGRLILAEGSNPHVGIALRLPVYRKGMLHDTVGERRRAYIGSVGAGIRVKDLMTGLLSDETLRVIHFRIYDAGALEAPVVSPSPSTMLFDSIAGVGEMARGPASAAGASAAEPSLRPGGVPGAPGVAAADGRQLSTSLVQLFGGRRWLIVFAADPAVLSGTQRRLPIFAAIAGTVISVLLSSLGYALSSSRVRAVRLAERITHTLRASEIARAEAQRIAHLGDWQISPDGKMVLLSNEMIRLLGWRRGAPTPAALMNLIDPADRAKLAACANRTLRTGAPFQIECRYRSSRGRRGWLHLIGHAYGSPDQRALRGTALEITQRKSAERAQQQEHAITLQLATATSEFDVFRQLIEVLVDGMGWEAGAFWPTEHSQRQSLGVTYSTRVPELERWLLSRRDSPSAAAAEGATEPCWSSGQHTLTRLAHAEWLAAAGITTVFTFPLRAGSTTLGMAEFYARDRRQTEPHALAMARSVAIQASHFLLRRQAEENLRFIANHDVLTGLPNRLMFRDQLEEALLRARRDETVLYVLFIDLDQFKDVNDSLGHNAGDLLLRAVADRLRQQVTQTGIIARLGGDEFIVLVEGQRDEPTDVNRSIDAVRAALADPFMVSGRQLAVTASIGISSFPGDGDDAQTLLKHADIAMYGAKQRGKNTHQLYVREMSTSLERRIDMESDLRFAVDRGEFVLYYQPRISLSSNRCTGVEALIRWNHPTVGLVMPSDFIPLAEQTGAIVPIGAWVLREACRQNAEWLAQGLGPIRVSVNLSARQFTDPHLHTEIVAALEHAQLPGELLELELTESMVMRHPEQAAGWLTSLKRTGVRLSIDDFGTGYSSLAYLNHFPIDVVKIDRSFIRDVPDSESDAQIASAVIALGHSLGLEVVAEGAETQAHIDFLRNEGCDEVQGYFFSRPIPASDMTAFLSRRSDRGLAEEQDPQAVRV